MDDNRQVVMVKEQYGKTGMRVYSDPDNDQSNGVLLKPVPEDSLRAGDVIIIRPTLERQGRHRVWEIVDNEEA